MRKKYSVNLPKWTWVYIVLLLIWILFCIFVPLVWPWSYSDQNADIRNQGMSFVHWFGTDKFGRDLFARVWYGAGISLLIGSGSALINGVIGVFWGAAAGYFGKTADMVLMRAADMICAIPSMLYVILFTLIFGAGTGSIIAGLCVSGWVQMARTVRGEILRMKEAEFILAAQMEEISPGRILLIHLLPNLYGPILINIMFLIPNAIITEAFLSFLGVGLAAPAASLGTIIQGARSQMLLYPYQMIWPLLVLCLMLLAFNGVGSSLEKITGEKK